MKVLFQFLLPLFVGGLAALSGNLPISPQEPAFLDNFNEQQKKAICVFLHEGLEKSIAPHNVTEGNLKQWYKEFLGSWRNKVDAVPTDFGVQKKGRGHHKCTSEAKPCPPHVDCANAAPITPEDVGSKGFVIKKSGYYCLKGKNGILSWNPSEMANTITIDADNVILDLNNTTIIQKASSRFASRAINVLPGHHNITIQNGNLAGFTAEALYASTAENLCIENIWITDNQNRNAYIPSLAFGSVHVQSSYNVILKNITVANSAISSPLSEIIMAGILLVNNETFLVENCEVVDAHLEAPIVSQCLGISMLLTQNGVIDRCRVSDCVSSGIMPAFGYFLSQNILTQNCTANYNTGTQTTSGYYSQVSDSLQFINCEANNNHSTCQDCHGFPYFVSTNGFFSNCRALNNSAVNPSEGFNEKTTGFEILVCSNCILEKCEAYNNTATNPIRHYAAGFANGNTNNVVFKNCISIGNNALGNTSRGVGFGPALDPRFSGPSAGTIWENCIAEGNFGDAQSIGFDLFGQIGGLLTGSISLNHGSVLINNGIGILSNGAYDQGNPVDIPCDVVPIVVLTENVEQHVIVKDNTVANNNFIGIADTTNANNLYVNNTVFNNGNNYLGPIFTEGTPIRDWSVSSPPSAANNNGVVGDKLDNLNAVSL